MKNEARLVVVGAVCQSETSGAAVAGILVDDDKGVAVAAAAVVVVFVCAVAGLFPKVVVFAALFEGSSVWKLVHAGCCCLE